MSEQEVACAQPQLAARRLARGKSWKKSCLVSSSAQRFTHNAIGKRGSFANMADGLGIIRVPFQSLDETLAKYTVPELQQELKRRGLKRSGVKNKLIQRLKEV